MMQRLVHLTANELLANFKVNPDSFSDTAIICGQYRRAAECLKHLKHVKKIFQFANYTFWTGIYIGKKITIACTGLTAPETAIGLELLAAGKIKRLFRIGSCGALKSAIDLGQAIIVEQALSGEGTSQYYHNRQKPILPDLDLTKLISGQLKGQAIFGKVWTTDALFRETKEIVNQQIEQGATCVDMISSAMLSVARALQQRACVVLIVSDNLISGVMGFGSAQYLAAQRNVIQAVLAACLKD